MNDTYITFTGWVGTDVTITDTGAGQQVATFRVGSTPRSYRQGRWENGDTAWYTVKSWRALATNVHASIRNGDAVVVTGRLVADVWDKGGGETSTRYVVVANSVGHDLAKGSSTFQKAPRNQNLPTVDDTAVKEVLHAYEESGPNLDANGDPVPVHRETPAA